MNQMKPFLCLSAAGLLLAALADGAGAQIVLNGTGASAGRQMMGSTPASNTFCLAEPRPRSYRNDEVRTVIGPDGTDVQDFSRIAQVTWVCNVTYSIPALGITFTNQPVEIRYHSTESGDGFVRLTGQYGNPTTATVINAAATSCGQGPIPIPVNSRQVAYDAFGNCTTTTATVNFGGSDVRATSFGQQGPIGTFFPPGGVPIDTTTIADEGVAVIPFGIFVSQHVRTRNADGTPGPAVETLTGRQIEAILRREVRNWDSFGYVVVTSLTPPLIPDPNQGITLCRRDAGSGTLAALWVTQTPEVPAMNGAVNGAGGVVMYRSSSSALLRDCVGNIAAGHSRRFISYFNAETILPVPNTRIRVDGFDPNLPDDPSFSPAAGGDPDLERKVNVICGRIDYWSEWRVTRRSTNDGTPVNNMVRAFADNIRRNTELSVPSGAFWARLGDMTVQKRTGDRSPNDWIRGVTASNPMCSR
jgi:hypothetical protein